MSVSELIQTVETLKLGGETTRVVALYETWVRHNQDNPLLYAVLFNYGVALTETGDLKTARECLERAISLNAEFMPAYINLGRVLERLGANGPAVLQWSAMVDKLVGITGTAITHKITALNQMARVLEAGNQDAPAEARLRQSLDIDRDQREAVQHFLALRQRQCEWPVVAPWDRVSRKVLMAGISPLSMAAYTDDPMLHLAAAWNYNLCDVGAPAATGVASHWAARETRTSGPLRIGYLSSDLRVHAVGHLMAEVFEVHDRSAVELFAYYCGPAAAADDPIQARVKAAVDHWVSVSDLDDAAAARRIADDGVQILVDVNGYTREGRTKLLALRPAPVIVNWLGFPGSMGSPYHNYIIADDWIIPPEDEIYYSESVLRLPCYQPNDRKRVVSKRQPSRQDAKLPADGMVYCCLNGTHKISRFTFERWLTILSRVPDSVLWLLGGAETAHERLRNFASERGIAPDRLIFAEKLANPDHLARYPLADLFLDTTPYGAHTTASDALWMGVPVLTLSGRSFASRVCGSLLRAAGLPELICTSPEEYVDRAVALGRDRAMTRLYRERLLAGRDSCTLFDTAALVRRLEELYARMWTEYQDGRLPRPDLANMDVYLEVGSEQNHDEVEVQAIKDYRAWWRDNLARRHEFRPIPPDSRLWTEAGMTGAARRTP
ncbi:MAG TPA: O-linked N-acetylglucosamine transferase [Stellaceae bacterium]|nr:O-linked N-acetylglucosamine transferase [Stellaceae bacterium]